MGIVLALALAGCGSDGAVVTDAAPTDAAPTDAAPTDAAPTDARSDAPVDATPTARLTVDRVGAGEVVSDPAGIACGPTCVASFTVGSQLTLRATAPGGVTFTGWAGACTGTGDCQVTLDADTAVTATFTGVPCTDECAAGQTECPTMSAERVCGQFDDDTCLEWSAVVPCAGGDECQLGRCGGAHLLSVAPLGEGMTAAHIGTVTSVPAGILCGRNGTSCQVLYADDSDVTLTATSDATAVFDGWALLPLGTSNGMHCVGSTDPCTVTMTEETTLVALYCTPECTAGTVNCTGPTTGEVCGNHDDDRCLDWSAPTACPASTLCTAAGCMPSFVATAQMQGLGGQVALDGVVCQTVPCSRTALVGESVTVTAIPAPDTIFTGWSGACTGTGPCILTATGTATANFAPRCATTSLAFLSFSNAQVTLGADTVYWRRIDFDVYLYRVPKAGGTVQAVANPINALVPGEPGPYWLRSDWTSIARLVGGTAEVVVTDATAGIPAVDATYLYYARNGTLQRVPKAGGAAVQLAAGMPVALDERVELLVDATNVYWFGGGTLVSVPVGGGAPVTLAAVPVARELTQDATHVYWANATQIVRVPKAGGAIEPLVNAANADFAVHDGTLVWYADRVQATRIGSGVVQTLKPWTRPMFVDGGIALDADAIYLISGPAGLAKLTRSPDCAPP